LTDASASIEKMNHGDTESTEKRKIARVARQTLLLRDLRASVVHLFDRGASIREKERR